jgi:hypothetical protein
MKTSNIKDNNVNEEIQNLISIKRDYDIAKKLQEYIKEFVLKSYAVEELKFLLEVIKMKENQAIDNYNNIKNTLKKDKNKDDENIQEVINSTYKLAKIAKEKINKLRKEVKKISADMNKKLNLASVELDAFLKLETNNEIIKLLNNEDSSFDSTRNTLKHLKNMHKKQIVINNQYSIDKNKLAGGYYIDYDEKINTITDNDIKKYALIDQKIAKLMDRLKDGQTSLMIATIALLIEKGLKLNSDKNGKCPEGQFDFSNVPEWTKRSIDSIPELGKLIDLIGNKLCMKKECPMKNSKYNNGLCYPQCKHSYKADKGLMCWKDYNNFDVNKENPELLNKKIIYNGGYAPNKCDVNEELVGHKCVPKCKEGYTSSGFSCVKKCINGTVENGMNCMKKQYDRGIGKLPRRKGCPPNYREDRLTCLKNDKCEQWWDECKTKDANGNCTPGLSTTCTGPLMIEREVYCNDNEEMINGLCYPKCNKGYDSYGSICYSKVESYVRETYERKGIFPECPNDHEKINGICYKKCPDGYKTDKPGVCIQICPKDTIDNRTTCTRTGYKLEGGKLQISIHKKPEIEQFTDISHKLDYYTMENYTNFGVAQPTETSYQQDSSYLFESFYNINTLVDNLKKMSKNEKFSLDFIQNNIKNVFKKIEGFNSDSFDTNRKYTHEFNNDDIVKGKIYESDGFFGLELPRTEGTYVTQMTKQYPIIKKPRSAKYNSYLESASKEFINKDNRPITKNYIVAPRMGGFATFDTNLDTNDPEFLKTSYKSDDPSHPEIPSFDISLYSPKEKSNDFSYMKKVLTAKEPEPEKPVYFSPLLQQIVKEMVNSFPLPQTEKPKIAKKTFSLIKKVERELDESDFKNKHEYKEVLKQIYIKGPIINVKPNLSEG